MSIRAAARLFATPLVSYGTGAQAQPDKPRLRLPSGCRAQSEENDGDRSSAAWLGFASYVWRGRFWVLPVLCTGLTQASRGWAYRPFDGTDAAVADVGEVEIELQPAGLLHQSSQSTLIAPFVVYNYGFAERWEFVVQGQTETPLCRHRVPAA